MGKYWKRGVISPYRAGKGAWNVFELLAIVFFSCLLAFMTWQWFYPARWKSFEAGWSNEFHIAPARASAASTIRDCSFTTEAGLDAIVRTVAKLNGATGGKSRIAQDIRACRTKIAAAVKAHRENYVQDSLLVYSTIPALKRTVSVLRSDSVRSGQNSTQNARKIADLQTSLNKALAVIAAQPAPAATAIAAEPPPKMPAPVKQAPRKKIAPATTIRRGAIKGPLRPCNRWGDTDPRICANHP